MKLLYVLKERYIYHKAYFNNKIAKKSFYYFRRYRILNNSKKKLIAAKKIFESYQKKFKQTSIFTDQI